MRRSQIFWCAAGLAGFAGPSWYTETTRFPAGGAWESALSLVLSGRSPWLAPLLPVLLLPLLVRRPAALVAAGVAGLVYLLLQGYAVGMFGWSWPVLEALPLEPPRQGPFGLGAGLTGLSFLFLLTEGLAALGFCRGDRFATGSIGFVLAAILGFVFLPVGFVLSGAVLDDGNALSATALWTRVATPDVWGLGCVTGARRCGVVWNTVFLGVLTGLCTTLLGLAFALVATRTAFPAKKLLRLLTVLPIITPPFVIGLAIILLFGRNGTVTQWMVAGFGLTGTRWIYGLPGILLTQVLAFTPIAFLVLIGVVQGVAPAMEEAAQTLRAGRWRTFRRVTWPLIRPGLASAFLIGFIESLADFGNPLVLGGGYDVLSVKIYFAVVGAQNDPGRAAALSLVLLALSLGAFYLQRAWVGRRSYTTLGGKGDGGRPAALPGPLRWLAYAVALPWAGFTLVLYVLIIAGGFVENWGLNHAFTLRHYAAGFGLEWGTAGLLWTGRAWHSLFTTLQIAAVSAPLTAGIGLLTAYLLARQRFGGQSAFEFVTMLSFAIPGTIIGVSYILAFNQPPVELTGTGAILVLCFIFRNMPVALRAGLASMSQIDRSLDESALTLRASSFQALRRVILPLLRPAIVAGLVYSFVRAITSVSAVIFLVSARHDMATSYIVGRVEAGDFGLAIAYSSVLILLMGAGIGLIQLLVGERRIGRRTAPRIAQAPA